MESILPAKKTLRDLASDFNLEIEVTSDQQDVNEAKQALMD